MQLALQDGSVEGYSHCILICTAAIYVRQYAPYCDSPPNAYEDEDDDDGGIFARKVINIRCVIIKKPLVVVMMMTMMMMIMLIRGRSHRWWGQRAKAD